jgi:hypothetical protein
LVVALVAVLLTAGALAAGALAAGALAGAAFELVARVAVFDVAADFCALAAPVAERADVVVLTALVDAFLAGAALVAPAGDFFTAVNATSFKDVLVTP